MRYLKFFVITSILLSFALNADAAARLAVRAFEDRSQDGNAPAAAIADMLVTELSKAGIFSILEREHLGYIADEIRLGSSGLVDAATAPKPGKIKGAEFTMTGAITLYYYNDRSKSVSLPLLGPIGGVAQSKTAYVTIDLRVIHNETGEVVYADAKIGSARQDSREPGLFNSTYNRTHGGILSAAARDAVMQHVESMRGRF